MPEPGEAGRACGVDATHRSARTRLVSALRRLDAALPISAKLVAPIVFVTVASGGILGFTIYRSEAARIRNDFAARAAWVSHEVHRDAVSHGTVEQLMVGDFSELQSHIDSLGAVDPSILRVDLVDMSAGSAMIMASTDHSRINMEEGDPTDLGDELRAVRGSGAVSHEDTIGDTPALHVAVPVEITGQPPFVVAVHMSTVERDNALAALLRNFALAVGSTVVLATIVLVGGLHVLIFRRIGLVLAFADRLQSGDLGARVEHAELLDPRDEMLRLGARFNTMAASIEALHTEIEKAAVTDELTGLYNRRFTTHTLEREIVRARRYGWPLSVIVADLDGLKQINDRLGHQAGDQAIRNAANALRDALRDCDYPCRVGGDELAAVLPDCDEEGLARVLDRLQIAATRQAAGEGTACTVSAGGAVLHVNDSVDTLLGRADGALYEAKRAGRSRSRIAA